MTRQRKRRGAALLEFAMALPFALTLFVGIGDFSVFFWRQTELEEVARDAAAKITRDVTSYTGADAGQFELLSRNLQEQLRTTSRRPQLTVELNRQYVCPLTSGAEQDTAGAPLHCTDERIYLRLAARDPVDPLLRPLRSLGFPGAAISRHAIRLR